MSHLSLPEMQLNKNSSIIMSCSFQVMTNISKFWMHFGIRLFQKTNQEMKRQNS
jgi:hypothetical protein